MRGFTVAPPLPRLTLPPSWFYRRSMPLPEFSRSAVIRKFGDPIEIEEVPIPRELEPGAILTRIEMCSICGTDVHLCRARSPPRWNCP
jgi:hypothetical protein